MFIQPHGGMFHELQHIGRRIVQFSKRFAELQEGNVGPGPYG